MKGSAAEEKVEMKKQFSLAIVASNNHYASTADIFGKIVGLSSLF